MEFPNRGKNIMKTLCLAIVLGGLALSSALQAQPSEDTVSVPVSARQLRIELPDAYSKMWPEDYRDLVAKYSLSNGQTLSIVARGTNMYAFVDQGPAHKIVATGRNNYVALDRQLKMEIDLQGSNGASGSVTMVVPSQSLSDGRVVPEQVVLLAFR
ncbi:MULTISPECIES: hypothetical protein [unclassified Duganella]|uniref:hypothetical protein n=1 Tax=unclassified Duganella TaxID=2636909 RepID=UPI0011C0D330|nr:MULTISPECIES: hypothetical protein [unclassified Duganella]